MLNKALESTWKNTVYQKSVKGPLFWLAIGYNKDLLGDGGCLYMLFMR